MANERRIWRDRGGERQREKWQQRVMTDWKKTEELSCFIVYVCVCVWMLLLLLLLLNYAHCN